MMALTAAGRWEAAGRMVDGLRAFGSAGKGTAAPLVRDYALPISEAILARAEGDPARACELMRPALEGMASLGGSHAQQDVLAQVFLDCAVKAKRTDDIKVLLNRQARYPVSLEKRVGYADAVRLVH